MDLMAVTASLLEDTCHSGMYLANSQCSSSSIYLERLTSRWGCSRGEEGGREPVGAEDDMRKFYQGREEQMFKFMGETESWEERTQRKYKENQLLHSYRSD